MAVVGPDTAWPGAKGRSLSEIKDPAKTILLVELADSGINWAEPRDLYVGQMALAVNPKAAQGVSSHHHGGAWVLFADGHLEYLGDDTIPEKLAAMLSINGKADAGQ